MRHIIVIILLFVLPVLHAKDACAQYDDTTYVTVDSSVEEENGDEEDQLTTDSTRKYERLYMDENKLKSLRRKKEFKYEDIDSANAANMKPEATSSNPFKGFDASIFLWVLAAFSVIVLILQFSNISMRQLLSPGKSSSSKKRVNELNENIHEIDYDQDIKEAIAAGNYSLAVRLLYLQTLKTLSDNALIKWNINKTNGSI
jgi:hypothetical protein